MRHRTQQMLKMFTFDMSVQVIDNNNLKCVRYYAIERQYQPNVDSTKFILDHSIIDEFSLSHQNINYEIGDCFSNVIIKSNKCILNCNSNSIHFLKCENLHYFLIKQRFRFYSFLLNDWMNIHFTFCCSIEIFSKYIKGFDILYHTKISTCVIIYFYFLQWFVLFSLFSFDGTRLFLTIWKRFVDLMKKWCSDWLIDR